VRVLLVDTAGLMTDFAMRCQEAGHHVKWFVRQSRMTLNIGKGFLTGKNSQVPDWHEWVRWADIIVLPDNVRYLHELDALREQDGGALIVGASVATALWETDRKIGQDLMKKRGLPVPEFRQFSNYDQAIAYVKREGRAFVCKPCGDEEDKSLSYVAKSPADLVFMLERWKKQQRHKDAFILQECVKGTEMAVGGWFGPGGFIAGWHENFEFKKLMAGDTGPATGEMGTVVRAVKRSKLAEKVLVPFE
jgi:phosphoribosylamine--glycine ligase